MDVVAAAETGLAGTTRRRPALRGGAVLAPGTRAAALVPVVSIRSPASVIPR
ncbi:hypothetical protein [Streptomyces sp. NPDC004579]|uniref:hypothetical protein n=1 Tax=Streptomyces sp. NPDC004579 TaxID=3154667 RepID=UPI0033AB96DE